MVEGRFGLARFDESGFGNASLTLKVWPWGSGSRFQPITGSQLGANETGSIACLDDGNFSGFL